MYIHIVYFKFRLNDFSFETQIAQLEKHLLSLEECYGLLTSAASARLRHEQFYARRRLLLTQWAWCEQVSRSKSGLTRLQCHDLSCVSGGRDLD